MRVDECVSEREHDARLERDYCMSDIHQLNEELWGLREEVEILKKEDEHHKLKLLHMHVEQHLFVNQCKTEEKECV